MVCVQMYIDRIKFTQAEGALGMLLMRKLCIAIFGSTTKDRYTQVASIIIYTIKICVHEQLISTDALKQ